MGINLSIISGTCVAVAILGFSVYWIIIKVKKTLRANQSNPVKGQSHTSSITKEIYDPYLDQVLNKANRAPDIPREIGTETKDENRLNDGSLETFASDIKKADDDWLNAGIEEVPTNFDKQLDDDWKNTENNQTLEILDESLLSQTTSNRPEIQIKQNGSILNITVTASKKQDIKSERIVYNLKINVYPQDLNREGKGLFDVEIATDESSPSSQSLQDFITVKAGNEPVNQCYSLMDEISIRPVENQVTKSYVLMDEITVKPVASLVTVIPQLMDEIFIRPVENQVTESHSLVDEISIKPSPGPINIEYELLDDLITKSAIYRTNKAITIRDTAITKPIESHIEKAEPVTTVSVNEIMEILNVKRDIKQVTIPSETIDLRSTSFLDRIAEGMGNLSSQARNHYKQTALRGVVTKVLGTLRIYNNSEFYIQDTNFTDTGLLMPELPIKDFTFKVINSVNELNELINEGYDLVINLNNIKRGLKKGMIVFLILVDRHLASMGWACTTEDSKANWGDYPNTDDLDNKACIVGEWTNPNFQGSGVSSYIKYKRQQLLKEKGFTFERSLVEENIIKDLRSMRTQQRSELTYKRRTYTNISIPGILGVEFWKEHLLNDTDIKLSYRMLTLLILVLPSPPKVS